MARGTLMSLLKLLGEIEPRLWRRRAESMRFLVPVLPLEPPTAMTWALICFRTWVASLARAARVEGTLMRWTLGSFTVGSSSTRAAMAPLAAASGRKARPSRSALMATKRAPGSRGRGAGEGGLISILGGGGGGG